MRLRIATWNVCRGSFPSRVEALFRRFDPDFAAFQEIPQPTDGDLSSFFDYEFTWYGKNPRQGVALAVRRSMALEALPCSPELPANTAPFLIRTDSGVICVLSVWTQPEPTYAESLQRSLEGYREYLYSHDSIVLGDFNASFSLDRRGGRRLQFRDVDNFMRQEFSLRSSWHDYHGEAMGSESMATLYHLRSREKPFHIDYIYVPTNCSIASAEIGSYSEWKSLSDHRPLTIDLTWTFGSPVSPGYPASC